MFRTIAKKQIYDINVLIKIGLKELRSVLYCSNAEDVSNFLTYALIHVELTFLTTSKLSRKDNWDLGRKTSAEAII